MPHPIDRRTYEHEGRSFELNLFADDTGYRVVVCREGKDVAGYPIQVNFREGFDYVGFMQWQPSLVDLVFQAAQWKIDRELILGAG